MKRGYLRHAITFLVILCMLGFLASCSSSGGSGNIDDYKDDGETSGTGGDTGGDEPGDDGIVPSSPPHRISLATSQVSVKSDDSDFATITATVVDKDNAVVQNATVSFSADGGTLSPDPDSADDTDMNGPKSEVLTDESGKAKIRFSSGSLKKSNRVVTITAKTEGVSSAQIPITVSGTTVTLGTGKTNLELDPDEPDKAEAVLTITVKDAGLQPIYDALVDLSLDASSTGDAAWELLPEYDDYNTDLSGQVRVKVTGTESGEVVLKAESLEATATQAYTVGGQGEVFSIIDPAENIVSMSTGSALTITVAAPGEADYAVVFASTLGTWDGGSESAVIKPKNEDKQASAVLRSSQAGLATVQVYRQGDISKTDSLVVAMSAPSSEATQIALQATATVVLPSTDGVNNTVTLIATVKNANDQVVGGAPVLFSIEDPTGGGESIAPVVVLTDTSGRAESTFTSGSLSSDANGVTVKAQVIGMPNVVPSTIPIVIGGTAGSVVIGAGSTIESIADDTIYRLPMSVLVSDTNGNAVSGAEVSLKAWPTQYSTGFWVEIAENECVPVRTGTFPNEDQNRNLILDPGEDVNTDGNLTPHSSAAGSLPSVVVTDDNGVANFDLVYLKASAVWIQAQITASTLVYGTETQANYVFDLPWLAGEECNLPHSPYNTPPEVELLVEAVPTVIPANGSSTSDLRVLVRDSKHNPIDGGEVYFSTDLGTVSSVAITDFNGYAVLGLGPNGERIWPTLTSEKQNGISTVTIRFETYTETIQVAFSGVGISVTASPESLSTSGESTVTATLKDSAGDPMAGQQVIVTTTLGTLSPGPGGGVVMDGDLIATTNTEGRVTALLTSNTGGLAEVTVYHGPTKGTAVETEASTFVSFSGVEMTITPEDQSLVADNTSTTDLLIELKNEGVPISDQTLVLSTTLGSIDYTVTTDVTGKATATLKAGSVVGVSTITATANLGGGNIVGGSLEFPFTSGIVNSLDLVVDPPIINVDTGTSDIAVTVRDASGNPVGGAQVAFTILSGPGGGETIAPARVTTPGPGSATPGQVSAVFKAGSLGSRTPGDVVILVTAGDEDNFVSETASLTIAGRPANIALGICAIFGPCVVNNEDGTFSMPVAAMVSDVNGISVPAGYLVYFSTDTPEVGALVSPVATDDSGKASTTLTFPASQLGGVLTILAETTGVTQEFALEIPFDDDEISNVTLSTPAIILADGVQQITVNAVAMEGDGDFSAGVSFFETNDKEDFTGDPVGAVTGTTYILFGETIAQFVADPSPNDYTVWMRAYSSDVLSEVKPIEAKGITVTIESATDSLAADGLSSTTLTAKVFETTSGRPVAFADIDFGASVGTVSGGTFTDASGTATATYTSAFSLVDRTATVSVYYGPKLSDSLQIELDAYEEPASGTIGKVDLTLGDLSLVADGLNSTTAAAAVQDFQGNSVVDGTVVVFATSGGSFVGASPDPETYTATTIGGVASAILQSSTMPGQYVVTASAQGITDLTSIEFLPGVAADIILTANPYVIKPEGQQPDTSSIIAVVVDKNNNIVADDTVVTFRTTAGLLSNPNLQADIALPIKTINTFQGVAPVVLHSGSENDLATVTAQVDGVMMSVNVVIGIGPGTGEPVFIQITAQPDSIQVKGTGGDESAWIQAAVRDAQGFPYDDSGIDDPKDNIQFEILTGPGGGEVLDAGADGRGASVTTSTTGGIAAVALNSGSLPGTVRIKVSVLKDTEGNLLPTPVEAISTPIGIEAGGPFSITIFKDENIINNGDGTYSWSISAMVRDQHGNPVTDDTGVYFGLVDNPDLGYKSAGIDGMATAGSSVFTSTATFLNDGVESMDTLIILEGRNEGGYVIDEVANGGLTLFYNLNESETSLDFVAGNAQLGEICGYGLTGNQIPNVLCVPSDNPAIKGVARSRLTWSLDARGFPFCIYAETEGRALGATLCDVYRSVEDVELDVTILPSSVVAGDTASVQAHLFDGAGNDLVGRVLTFTTSNTGISGFGAIGTDTTTAVTDLNGRATVDNLVTATCLEGDSTNITVAAGDVRGQGILMIVGTQPQASFSTASLGGYSVLFTDGSSSSTGTVDSWSWDFGDGAQGSGEQVTHDYADDGIYAVELTVTNTEGCTNSIIQPVTIGDQSPTASFSWLDLGDGSEVSFTDTSTTPAGTTVMSWAWDFGDGSTSTEQNPTRLFAGPGSYQVTLTVTNEFTSSEPAVEIVEVAEPAQPVASFDWTDLGNGNEVAFVDTSDSGDGATITAWSWDFDNGAGSSTVQNPVYSFGGPGAYPVRLTVTNSFMETDQVLDIVNVDPAPVPTADFTFQSVGVNEVSFTDTSTTPVGTTIDSWDWDFGDGGTSAAQNPTYTFGDAGPHAVELTVTNSATGTDTSVQLVPAP